MANSYYSTDAIQRLLQVYKENKDRYGGFKAPDYRTLAPKELNTDVGAGGSGSGPAYEQLQSSILQHGETATATQAIEEQNQKAWEQMMKLRKLRAAAAAAPTYTYSSGSSSGMSPMEAWGYSDANGGIPNLANDPTPFNINAGMTTFDWRGFPLTLNKSVVDNFTSFLNGLWKTGYRPSTIGSFADRNIAGTNTPSLHSYGLAIDIDPSRNPVTWNGVNITALPAGIGALAARYGLMWGGSWNGQKRDTMHFSWPYAGTY